MRLNPAVLRQIANSREVTDQQETVAVAVQKVAQRRAPKRTGQMAKGIKVEKAEAPDGLPEYRVGWDKQRAFAGPLTELGTEHTPAQPHLRPAADEIAHS